MAEEVKWTEAKTYADAPHQYVLRHNYPELFAKFRALIRNEGVIKLFSLRGHSYNCRYYFPGDGFRYWIMDNVLNRCPEDQTYGQQINVTRDIKIKWRGPFGWPKFEGDLPSIPKVRGVYLWTVEYQNGYLIYVAGFTRRPMPERFREHTRNYMSGMYFVLDIGAMQRGVRKEVWPGFWTGKRSRKQQAEYHKRQTEIQDAARKQLEGFRVFVAKIGTEPRILERLEAAIMGNLSKQPAPFCDIPDPGMHLAPRWESETPITIHNKYPVTLHGLPSRLII